MAGGTYAKIIGVLARRTQRAEGINFRQLRYRHDGQVLKISAHVSLTVYVLQGDDVHGSEHFSLPVHPVAAVFPMLSDAEIDELAADIKANGLRCPITIDHEGTCVVDGRNRREACRRAGVEVEVEYLGRTQDVTSFIILLNLKRRHLDESQRSMVAALLANLAAGEKKDRTAAQICAPALGGLSTPCPVSQSDAAECEPQERTGGC